MRGPEGSASEAVGAEARGADGRDRGDFERFSLSQRRKNTGQPLCQHALARPRRTDHQQAVCAGCRDNECALCMKLPADVGEIR